MADEIRAGGAKRMGRTARTGGGKGSHKATKGARPNRIRGLKMVDTIPRTMEKDYSDGESMAMDRLAGSGHSESFSGEAFEEDLQRAHAFVTELASHALQGSAPAGLHEECERILKEEVLKARFVAMARKGGAKP